MENVKINVLMIMSLNYTFFVLFTSAAKIFFAYVLKLPFNILIQTYDKSINLQVSIEREGQ